MKIKIDIFSGFFGAGKTTLIKKLINENQYPKKVVIIENEFGEIGIDGVFLEKYNIEVKEINAGCICCSTLNDFKKTLQEIINSQEIERIIIEPSGVGKLSEIIGIVKKLESENDVFLNLIISVVDVTMYNDFIDFFSEFYKDQIIHATTVVLSRTQNVNYEELQTVVSKIRVFNKKATIVTRPWDNLSSDAIVEIGEKDRKQDLFEEINLLERSSGKAELKITKTDLAEDVFNSWVIETPKIFSLETLKGILNKLKNEELCGNVLRSKGIVQVDENRWIEFDFVPKQFEMRDTEPFYTGRICVIGTNLNKENLNKLF